MSNHITCDDTKIIKLVYTNGIETYVPCIGFNPRYVKQQILDAIRKYEERTSPDDNIVWDIDFNLNYNCECSQFSMVNLVDTIEIGYPYDLGENEEEGVIKKLQGNREEVDYD